MHRGRGEDEDCAPRERQNTRQPVVRSQPKRQIHQETKTGDTGFVIEIWPHGIVGAACGLCKAAVFTSDAVA